MILFLLFLIINIMYNKYYYISDLDFDGGVYQSQIIDWLELFNKNGLNFELIQIFQIQSILKKNHKKQKQKIKNAFSFKTHFWYLFPNVYFFRLFDKYIFYLYLIRSIYKYPYLVFFSRADIGGEMVFLKKIYPNKIKFIYDLRGAWVEEHLWSIKKNNSYSIKQYRNLSRIYYSEFLRQKVADKIFVVSNTLKDYFINHYNSKAEKFVLYPCLSSSDKFYFDVYLRIQSREELGFENEDIVFVYSGGVLNKYHIPDSIIRMFDRISKYESRAKLLLLIKKSSKDLKEQISNNKNIKLIEGVPNNKVVDFLNAADYGFLLRENIILNNVAFPTKFAEYLLSGLPVIISESLIDCVKYCKKYNSGFVVSNSDVEKIEDFSPKLLINLNFDKNKIAKDAKALLSKESVINNLVRELKKITLCL